jgi:hypothetical protein
MHASAEHTERMANGHFFDSGAAEELLRTYQTNPDQTELLGEVITRCRPIALSLIRSRAVMRYEDCFLTL